MLGCRLNPPFCLRTTQLCRSKTVFHFLFFLIFFRIYLMIYILFQFSGWVQKNWQDLSTLLFFQLCINGTSKLCVLPLVRSLADNWLHPEEAREEDWTYTPLFITWPDIYCADFILCTPVFFLLTQQGFLCLCLGTSCSERICGGLIKREFQWTSPDLNLVLHIGGANWYECSP